MRSWWLLLLLVATATVVSCSYDSSGYGEHVGSCKHAYGHYYNERGKHGKQMHKRHKTDKLVIYPPDSYPQELSPVDWAATKALPKGYPVIGWVVHVNGRCSFRGYQMPRCPTEADKAASSHQKEDGEDCMTGKECCSHKCVSNTCCPHFKFPPGKHCNSNDNCCSNVCDFGKCCEPGLTVSRGTCTEDEECCSQKCRDGICCPPHTRPNNATCQWASQCCSNQCYVGKCCPLDKKLDSQPCSNAEQCCSGKCNDNLCCPRDRKFTNEACSASSECCNGRCQDKQCCPLNQQASGPQSHCTSNGDCCSGICDPVTTVKPDGHCCAHDKKLTNATCLASTECCNSNCVDGICCPINLRPAASNCTAGAECCSGVCENGFCCAKKRINDTCTTADDCCSGKCEQGKCQDPTVAANCLGLSGAPLLPLQADCLVNGDCCSGKCDRYQQTNFIVQGLDPRTGQCCVDKEVRGGACGSNADCCGGNCLQVSGFDPTPRCCAAGTVGINQPCQSNADCCGDNCVDGSCSNPTCFSGDSKVRILESPTPVTMRDLQTGQHMECLHSAADLMAPTTPQWCEVMNFAHADSITVQQQRISFSRLDGSAGSITVSETHLVYKVTGEAPHPSSADTVAAFGSFQLLAAKDVQADDKLVVAVDPMDATKGFAVAAVIAVESVQAEGLYLPVIEHPYLVVDGVVMPLWTWTGLPLVASPDDAGAMNALLHYTFAPLFMQRLQPLGTPGQQCKWGGSSIWPGVHAVLAKLQSKHSGNGRIAVDFTAAQQLFLPRYHAWTAAKSAQSGSTESMHSAMGAVTLEQVLGTLDAVVVPLEGDGGHLAAE